MEGILKLIIVGVIGIIACIAVLIIDRIHRKVYTPGSILESQNEDIIDILGYYKKRQLQKTPWAMNYRTYKMIATISAIALALVTYLGFQNILVTIMAASFGLVIPEIFIHLQGTRHKSEYEERFATGLRQLVAALKSGLTIQQAVSDVCTSPFVHDSIKAEFKAIDADLKLGISVKDAFQSFADRVHFQDAVDVSIAIAMQEKVGGKEAQVIESIAKNISDRIMLRKEVNSLFAGANATVLTMDILPFAIILMMYLLTPSYLSPFFQDIGLMILFIVLLAVMGIGSVMIHRTIQKFRRECGL